MTFLQRHFPKNKASWKSYIKIFLPIIFGSTLFALNGVVDNFMVGHINQGVTALGAINSWTNILTGWFLGTAAAGSVVMAQFYHAKKFDIVKQIARYRYILTMSVAILLSIVTWITPDTLTRVFYSGNNQAVLENARIYSRIIAIQWILISISFNLGNQIREMGLGKYSMYWAFGSLGANVILNATLMYGIGMGVDGAAWASVAGRIVSISSGVGVIIWKKLEIGFKPWTLFQVSFYAQKLFWKRWIYFMSIFTVTFFVTYRNHFYDQGFVTNSLGIGVGALSVLGLTTALMNIFTTTFSALASMSAFFVGSELGKGNLELAKKRGDEVKGFTTLMALFLAIFAAIFATLVPYMSFISETQHFTNFDSVLGKGNSFQAAYKGNEELYALFGINSLSDVSNHLNDFGATNGPSAGLLTFYNGYSDNVDMYNRVYGVASLSELQQNIHMLSVSFDSGKQLAEVRNSVYAVTFFYPIWIWFTASYRIGNSGGKGGWFAFVDWFVSGPLQLGWVAILMLVIVPASSTLQENFGLAYSLFFLSDLLKLVGQEYLYYKYDWLNSLTKEEVVEKKASAKKYLNEDTKTP